MLADLPLVIRQMMTNRWIEKSNGIHLCTTGARLTKTERSESERQYLGKQNGVQALGTVIMVAADGRISPVWDSGGGPRLDISTELMAVCRLERSMSDQQPSPPRAYPNLSGLFSGPVVVCFGTTLPEPANT